MSGYYVHSRKVFELYIKKPQILMVCEVILYSVRYNPYIQDGIQVEAGQCLMKYEEIAKTCGVTVSQVRTALRRFVADGGISIENKGKKGILITLLPPFSCEAEKAKSAFSKKQGTYSVKNTYKEKTEASYDLQRAEERARKQVPKLKKRA